MSSNNKHTVTLTPEQAIEAAKAKKATLPHKFDFGHGKMTKQQAARVRLLARAGMHEWALLEETENMLDTEDIEIATRKADFESPRNRGVILAPRVNRENGWVYYQNPSSTIRWMVQEDGMVYINGFASSEKRSKRKRIIGISIDPCNGMKRSNWRGDQARGEVDTIIDVIDTVRALGVDESALRAVLEPVFRMVPQARIVTNFIEDEEGQVWVFLDDEEVAADVKLEDGDAKVRFFGDEDGLMDPTLLEALEPRINEVLKNCGQEPLSLRID